VAESTVDATFSGQYTRAIFWSLRRFEAWIEISESLTEEANQIMSMKIIDISRTLEHGMAVWPGDRPYNLVQLLDRSKGDVVNLTTLTFSAHTGSHVDAPHHFADHESTIEQLDLRPYWGTAQVVTIERRDGPLTPADFAGFDLGLAKRLLVRSPAGDFDPTLFPDSFIYPGLELANHLGELGVLLYGTESPSMDNADSKSLDGHRALRRNQIAILEWLDLREAPDGLYELVALPLKIKGGDGSPVRAVLKSISSHLTSA
jgi:arylformamidase